jgi:cathepsin A (carboxypeptidase C)
VANPVDSDVCDVHSKSGYLSVKGSQYDENGEDKHLFYWMFDKRNSENDDSQEDIPFVVWLTGGPGCSSTLALLAENGPCKVSKDGESTTLNPYSWTEAAHVLWLDQPAGVGFSYGEETDSNEAMISEDAYYFLQSFVRKFPQYRTNPLYIVGESYGGHYAPAIAHRVWRGNKSLKQDCVHLNLRGVGIGNGLTNPEEQYKWYAEMAYNNSHHIQAIDEKTYEAMQQVIPKCTALIHKCNEGTSMIDSFACQTAFVVCNLGLTSPYQMTGLNPYDIRKACGANPLCYDFSNIEHWLHKDSTRKALHVSDDSPPWQSCNMGINLRFHEDWMKDFSPYVADLLNDGIPALIYAGDVDFICNYLGNRAWTLGLDWKHGTDFRAAEEHDWKGQGLARSSGGLTFLQVYDAGHMVPSDQPEVALDMITNFLNGGEF